MSRPLGQSESLIALFHLLRVSKGILGRTVFLQTDLGRNEGIRGGHGWVNHSNELRLRAEATKG